MTHDEEKYLQHKMDTASLKELFPEFDKETEWGALAGKLKPRSVPDYKWMRIAAILLVVVGIGGYLKFMNNNAAPDNHEVTVASMPVAEPKPTEDQPKSNVHDDKVKPEIATVRMPVKARRSNYINNRPLQSISAMALATGTYGKSTEAICNATKCAIEICISQTVKCKDKAPAAVADCRTLEPDQAGPLKYTDPERYGCTVTVDEIRIKKVATGETIVINSDTQPASAEEMLQCFTGEKKCDMLAGFFNTDCNDENSPRKITIDSHYGDVIIQ